MAAKKQSFLQGAVILTASTVIVKIIGMFYKIPLGNILGAVGMSYFMTAYNIFNPIYALSVAGFPVAVSKMVSESIARHRYRETKAIFHCSFALFLLTGLVGFAIMFFGADYAATLVDNPDANLAIMAMAPAIFFCCVVSAYRGYYQGLGNMNPTAASQVLESLFKMACGIVFALWFLERAKTGINAGGLAFGGKPVESAQAELMALPWAAAGAILGVTVSSVVSAVYLALRYGFGGDSITKNMLAKSPASPKWNSILKSLTALALPVCLGSVLTNITSLIDVATIMNRITVATQRGGGIVASIYRGLIPPEITAESLPRYLYGAYGYCSSLFNLVPALTVSLGVSALPLIASGWALGNREQAFRNSQSVVKLSALIAIPAGLGLCALAGPILALLYPARMQEAAIAAPMLRSLGIAAVFVGITAPVNSIFQAVGRADVPVKLMAAGAAFKIAANYFLLAIPELNINAAPYGTILCYFFIFCASIFKLQNIVGAEFDMTSCMFKPLFCGILCAVSANRAYTFLENMTSDAISCLISIAIGGIIYLFSVLVFKIITKNEILLLPKGKKIAKALEKVLLLG